MNRQELERLIASLTDDELQQIRDYRPAEPHPDPETPQHTDPMRAANRKFVKSLLGGDDD